MNNINPFVIASKGTENITSRRRKNIIYSYNALLIFYLSLTILLLINEVRLHNTIGAIIALFSNVTVGFIYFLSRKGNSVLSTFLFCFVMPCFIFFLSVYYKGVTNCEFYFAFFILVSLIFSFSNIRRILLSIFIFSLYLLGPILTNKYGFISSHTFNFHSNTGLLITFAVGAFLLVYMIVINSSKEEIYIDGILDRLKKQNEQLERTNEKLQHFTQIASHDLKVPLIGVTSLIEITEKKISNQDYNSIPELLDTIKRSTKRMSNMIKETLEYGKVSNYEAIPNTDVDVQKVVDELFADLKYTYPKAILIHNNLPVIRENEDRVKKVFQNLMENGLKYNNSEEPTVEIIYLVKESGHFITITDNGIGIDPAYIDTIFKPYKRLHREEEYPGTGLGLPIVKEIVEMSGGTITVSSILGKGTTFNLTFLN